MGLRLGRYETTERLAAGGMATVYLGRAMGEGGFERLVAIKVMHEHVASEPDFRSMFLDEARLAARIRHPNVVAVIDIQRTPQDQLFLVMDFVDGPSLFQLRKKLADLGQKLPIDVTLRIFIDTLSGLHAAHELTGPDGALLHLVHRDVSPQNILVGKDGITRITDFGVARAEARITSTRGGQVKGKIAYMPPEQLRNEELDLRADVYGAGVAFWEALTGRRLFEAMSDAALVHMIMGGVKQTPADVEPSVPAAISSLCMQALEPFKEDRPESAAAFADAIEETARGAGVEIASARRVASFLASLPKSVSSRPGAITGSLPAAPALSLGGPAPADPQDARETEVAKSPAAERATVPEINRAATVVEGTTTRSVVTATGPVVIPKHSRTSLYLAAALGVAATTVGAFYLFRRPADAPSLSPAAPADETTTTTATAAPSAEAPPTVTPSPVASSSVATPAPTASVSASAVAPAAPPLPGAGKPVAAPPPTSHVGPGYDPKGL